MFGGPRAHLGPPHLAVARWPVGWRPPVSQPGSRAGRDATRSPFAAPRTTFPSTTGRWRRARWLGSPSAGPLPWEQSGPGRCSDAARGAPRSPHLDGRVHHRYVLNAPRRRPRGQVWPASNRLRAGRGRTNPWTLLAVGAVVLLGLCWSRCSTSGGLGVIVIASRFSWEAGCGWCCRRSGWRPRGAGRGRPIATVLLVLGAVWWPSHGRTGWALAPHRPPARSLG